MDRSLLAKPISPDRSDKSLGEHTRDVVEAAEQLFGTAQSPTRLGNCWLRFFRLPTSDWTMFSRTLTASCLLHDWGKANDRMQAFFYREPMGQLFRHEHLSAMLMGYQGVWSWLAQCTEVDWQTVLPAVGSHHLRSTDKTFASGSIDEVVRMHVTHSEFQEELIGETARRLGLKGQPMFPAEPNWGLVGDPATFNVTKLRDQVKDRLLKLKSSPMLHAVRAALIAADAVGSAMPRTNYSMRDWVGEQFSSASLVDAHTIRDLIARRLAEIRSQGNSFKWNSFQEECERLPDRALLLAPCGSGKTLAAWRWVQGRLAGGRRAGRVMFLYPTRATATEGFKDYVSWAPESHASLLQGTSSYDLADMFPSSDSRSDSKYEETDPRLFALRHWSKRIFSATVDQFLSFMSYSYRNMCLLPLLADSVIVVDEVHSFDNKMFSALLGFLENFDVPVLCMTASLQGGRRSQLQPWVDCVYDKRLGELEAVAHTPRYHVAEIAEQNAEQVVREAVAKGQRVLWVVNQVNRAQQRATSLLGHSVPVICYHSRFKLADRIERHRETVEAMLPGQPAVAVVATQVCELGLDIDADVLVTEGNCPITSLIQRMGRCRRSRTELSTKGPGEVYVYQPEADSVYSLEVQSGVAEFIKLLESKSPVSQQDLEEAMKQLDSGKSDAPSLNSFLRSDGYADGKEDSFRDIESFNVDSVLNDEVDLYAKASAEKKPGFVVPVPRKLQPGGDPRLPRYMRVGNRTHYHPLTGYHDRPVQ